MRVIGAGLPRTATLSQKLALEALGLSPCCHMVNVLSDLSQAPLWRRALDGDLAVQEILKDHIATVDWPGSFFYAEMLDIYPEAKVILSVRDGDAWAQSMHATIWGMFYDTTVTRHLSEARACVDPMWDGYVDMMKDMWHRSGLLNGDATPLGWLSAAMTRHDEEVQRTVPPARLLVWAVTDGWEPLCDFLGLPVPDLPFPCVNDARQFDGRIIDASLQAIAQARAGSAAALSAI